MLECMAANGDTARLRLEGRPTRRFRREQSSGWPLMTPAVRVDWSGLLSSPSRQAVGKADTPIFCGFAPACQRLVVVLAFVLAARHYDCIVSCRLKAVLDIVAIGLWPRAQLCSTSTHFTCDPTMRHRGGRTLQRPGLNGRDLARSRAIRLADRQCSSQSRRRCGRCHRPHDRDASACCDPLSR